MAFEIAKLPRPKDGRRGEIGEQTRAGWRPPISSPRPTLETSVSEVALMWILHQHALSVGKRNELLSQQVFDFSTIVFKTILQDSPSTKHEHLWMIYFKGLIVSNTHTREIMVQAIHEVQARNTAMWRASVGSHESVAGGDGAPSEMAKPTEVRGHADSDVLHHINTALGNVSSNPSNR